MKKYSLISEFLIWRRKHINDRQFIVFLSIIVGVFAGFGAVIIKNSVHLIKGLISSGFTDEYHNYLYFIYPAIGILLAIIFMKYIIKAYVGHGIPGVLSSISQNNGIMKLHNIFSSIITSVFTVGFGGSVGLEGPTVATGAAIGSNVGRFLHLNYKQLILLLGCASAGAMSAIFKAPIAGVVFALEVIMLDLTMYSILPILLASVSAALTSYLFLGFDVLCPFEVKEQFIISDIPFYIVLGIVTGFISLYFIRTFISIDKFFDKIKRHYTRLIIGGLALGILIFLFPCLYGEGYETINACLQGDYTQLFNNSLFYAYKDNIISIFIVLFLVIIFKVIAMSVTFGSGGVGGVFAPTLFVGACVGSLFAKMFNYFNLEHISESNFALVGMAGMISGVLHAPLTAIFLIAEITNGYGLFMPLIIVATISYATIRMFEPNSIYAVQLAKRNQLFTHNKDKIVLSLMKIDELIETDFKTVHPDATLRDLVKIVSDSKRNIFPVVDDDNVLHGIVTLDSIRHIMFRPDMYDNTYVHNLMFMPTSECVNPDDSMEDIVNKFKITRNFNLPVVKDCKYIGFVSRANIFSVYRKKLKYFSED
jgi:CIC family chloride channel protein